LERAQLHSETTPQFYVTSRCAGISIWKTLGGSFTLDLCRHLVDLEIASKDPVLVQTRRSNRPFPFLRARPPIINKKNVREREGEREREREKRERERGSMHLRMNPSSESDILKKNLFSQQQRHN